MHAVWLAARDPCTPWFAKVIALVVAAYAFSPIDLIPDFIPVLGYLDDIILVPLGVILVVKLIPPEVMDKHREVADSITEHPTSQIAVGAIIIIWIIFVTFGSWLLLRHISSYRSL